MVIAKKGFSVDLIEDSYTHYFSVDSRDKKEYVFRKKTGILKRKYEQDWVSHAVELNSISDANEYISRKIKPDFFRSRNDEISLNPGKIMRENEFILNFLHNLDLKDWKVIFRLNNSKKIVTNGERKGKVSNFKYFSILIKIRLNQLRNYVEVGEGMPFGASKINQTGLSSRVKDILDNHRNSRKIDFKDKIPVILKSGDGGIFLHEILGHSLEADHIYQQMSPISLNDLNKQIVSQNVNLMTDDKKDDFFRGITCDDEGFVPESSVLVESGVLRNLLSDFFYKDLLKINSCGYSRLEDFTKIPMPRMHALYLKPGKFQPEELIESTKYGVFAKEFGEGKVYFEKNLFYFNINEAYLIEEGKISSPLGNIVVRGNIIEVLNSVDMIATDFQYDKGVSYCYKNGQTLNVRVGQPTVKIKNLFVTKETND